MYNTVTTKKFLVPLEIFGNFVNMVTGQLGLGQLGLGQLGLGQLGQQN